MTVFNFILPQALACSLFLEGGWAGKRRWQNVWKKAKGRKLMCSPFFEGGWGDLGFTCKVKTEPKISF